MKHFKISTALVLTSLLLNSCNDMDIGMQYEKLLLAQKGDISVYCYCVSWTSNAIVYYISFNKDVCLGFDSTKDYCYGKGYQEIYYKFYADTLRIFSYGSKASIPKQNVFNISMTSISHDSLAEYEKKYENKEIEKVSFDSFRNIPCDFANPPINTNDLKFKQK